MKNKLNILLALLAIHYAKVVITNPLQYELPPECKILNFETVESYPNVIEVNDKKFVIQGQLQHGATSRVFHAFEQHDNSPKRCMAIKVIDLDKIEHKLKNQATNEAKILGELNSKNLERIPKLFEIEQHPTKNTLSMVMELAHHDLFDEITPNMGREKHEWVRDTLKEILQAIQPLHQNGIVHGDLKPENMAYFRAPRAINTHRFTASNDDPLILKVIDFGGVMKNEQLSNACEEIVTGTVMYMSPEQVAWCASHDEEEFLSRRKQFQLSKKSDIWSIGIILYQMLFGHSPYSWITEKYAHLDEEERGEKTDVELRRTIFDGKKKIEFDENYKDFPILEIVKRCLQRNPKERPEIDQILGELEKLENKLDYLEKKIEKLEKEKEEKIKEEEEEEKEEEEKERLAEENKKRDEENARLEEDRIHHYNQQMAAKRRLEQENWQQKNQNFGRFNNGYFWGNSNFINLPQAFMNNFHKIMVPVQKQQQKGFPQTFTFPQFVLKNVQSIIGK